ncbi:MAG TPA: hypothetical protein PKX48_08335 [Planctomycetota bacterium]|nr:hypothetical protein [Planctomycetota bacterium]OQC20879.1 MAG: hypothetical protein BWX69_01507 [Planctomycetes bacterium ADurb.Bin069]HNR99599.1 hypothetical protein [Planctomycetota bacterium]HNU25658.1 hypothetical protein [Planctomycetota bacterium]HOE29967.1 hypothetical protein [Planctomycetota bacterium]
MTLIELLMVLAIVTSLLGLSFAGLQAWKRRSAAESCLAEVALRLREARNFAVSGSVGSVVDVNPDGGTLVSSSFVPVALLDFDGEEGGATRRGATVESGRLGNGANLSGGDILFENASALVGANGAAVRAWLCLLGAPPRGAAWTLCAAGEWLAVQVTPDLALTVRLGPWTGTTRGRAVAPGRWHDVLIAWQRGPPDEEFALQIDGIDVRLDGPERLAVHDPGSDPFVAGLKLGPLGAVVDEVQVFARIESPEHGISDEFLLVGPRRRIHFAPSGMLDLRYHDQAVAITIAEAAEVEAALGGARTVVKSEIEAPARGSARVWVELSGRVWSERLRPVEEAAPSGGTPAASEAAQRSGAAAAGEASRAR